MFSDYGSQDFFVLDDPSYDRIFQKLTNGSRFEWSFPTKCPEPPGQVCTCPRFMNVLSEGKIVRIVNGKQKPVYKGSDFLQQLPSAQTTVDIFTERFHTHPRYADYLKEGCASMVFPILTTIYTPTQKYAALSSSSEHFCEMVDSIFAET